MSTERVIIAKLFEGRYKELDEKTYTVGDTQYYRWKGQTYKWTSANGRSECSEEEYNKAVASCNKDAKETPPESSAPQVSPLLRRRKIQTEVSPPPSKNVDLSPQEKFESELSQILGIIPNKDDIVTYRTDRGMRDAVRTVGYRLKGNEDKIFKTLENYEKILKDKSYYCRSDKNAITAHIYVVGDKHVSIEYIPESGGEYALRIHSDNEYKERVAEDTDDPELLDKLSKSRKEEVRWNVVRNPHTSAETLRYLSEKGLSGGVAKHPNAPADLIISMFEGGSTSVLQNENLPLEMMKQAVNSSDKYRRSSVAENKGLPGDLLRKLANDKEWIVRKEVAENPSTPPDALKKLSTDKGHDVLERVAENPNTPPEVLYDLVRRSEKNPDKFDLRSEVLSNINVPEDLIRKYAKNTEWSIRCRIVNNPSTPTDVLQDIASGRFGDSQWNEVAKNHLSYRE